MTEQNSQPGPDPYKFIKERIDTVPHLEALILFWNSRPVGWTAEELASRLYVAPGQIDSIIRDLTREQLIRQVAGSPEKHSYFPLNHEQNELMHSVDAAYRRDLVRISGMIHSKASSAVREFARAFRIRKERES
jgi:DNA-binding MarR family transcriptional regulator